MIFMIALNDCLEWLVMVLMKKQQCNKLVISSKIKETSGICWFCLYPRCWRKSSRSDCQYGRWQKKGRDALINSPIFHHIKNLNNSGVWIIFTGRNEVVAKVMFLHMSVILLTGGVSGEPPPGPGRPPPPPPGTRQTPPPRPGRNTPGPGRHHSLPDQGGTPPDQADTTSPPPGKKTAAYGQWAAGTHPTGMHSCAVSVDFIPPNTSN